ncbi:hypothetical protein yc1106_00129 [Curvularia clavata]|uniref:Uncharacterized protein n=1 Tax=Curvularia clavata TaxID=95742 RepID=A0A9Q8YZV7_CURCL|nr:hypothetical protein yc1106_00129 [Curvularia clavata]
MAGENDEALSAAFARLNLAQATKETRSEDKSTNKPPSSNPTGSPTRIVTRRVPHISTEQLIRSLVHQLINSVVKRTQSSNATNEDTAINNSIRARKDSHSGNDIENSGNKPSEIDTLKSELVRLEQRNEGLEKEAKGYKVKLEKALSENRLILGKLEDKDAELAACRQELEDVEKQWKQKLEFLIGTENIGFDDIRFEKVYNDDYSTELTVEAEFRIISSKNPKFSYKRWEEKTTGRLCRGHDDGAIAVVEMSGQFYAAKCGKKQENLDSFIDKEYWTKEVISLFRLVGLELKWGWAQHAELQLIAFCITRFLQDRGFGTADLKNPKVYEANSKCPFLVTIYVSQEICEECQKFIDKIQKVVGEYGWWFNPVNRRRYSGPTSLQVGQRTKPSSEYLVR